VGNNTKLPNKAKQMNNRRDFFHQMSDGLFGAALMSLLGRDLFGKEQLPASRRIYDLTTQKPQHEPKAKAVIQLFMQGGPSQVDLFDPKPMLDKHHGKPVFKELAKDVSSPDAAGGLMRSPWKFSQH